MTEPKMVPTRPRPAAGLVAGGLLFTITGGVLILAGLLTSLAHASAYDDPGTPLTVMGIMALVGGLGLLVVGVYRLVQHADRLGGVRFPADPYAAAPAPAPAPTAEVTDAS